MQQVAHRGGSLIKFQENSYEIVENFFDDFISFHLDGIEIDIVETEQGDFLCLHGKKESKRMTGKDINLLKMTRDEIKKEKIQKNILRSHEYDIDQSYNSEANFIFIDEIFEMYKKKNNKNIVLVLDIKEISKKGCKKLKKMIKEYGIPENNLKLCGYGLVSSYYISKHFPGIYKEWFIVLDSYSSLPYCIERIYNWIMYYLCDDWTALSIAMYDTETLGEQMKFKRKNYKLSYFGCTNDQISDLVREQIINRTNNISYFCVDV